MAEVISKKEFIKLYLKQIDELDKKADYLFLLQDLDLTQDDVDEYFTDTFYELMLGSILLKETEYQKSFEQLKTPEEQAEYYIDYLFKCLIVYDWIKELVDNYISPNKASWGIEYANIGIKQALTNNKFTININTYGHKYYEFTFTLPSIYSTNVKDIKKIDLKDPLDLDVWIEFKEYSKSFLVFHRKLKDITKADIDSCLKEIK